MGRTANKQQLLERQAESRLLTELNRTLHSMVRLHKSRAAEKVSERTDDDLRAELLESLRKIADARGT